MCICLCREFDMGIELISEVSHQHNFLCRKLQKLRHIQARDQLAGCSLIGVAVASGDSCRCAHAYRATVVSWARLHLFAAACNLRLQPWILPLCV